MLVKLICIAEVIIYTYLVNLSSQVHYNQMSLKQARYLYFSQQVQLSTIQEQNSQRDATFKQLEKDIRDIRGSKRFGDNLEDTPKSSKRCRKSPRGLSVS